MGYTTAIRVTGLLLAILLEGVALAQTTHLIRGVDFEYIPDTAYLIAGDSIHFDPTNGLHNMTETSFSDWSNNQAITNGGFDTAIAVDTTFVIDTAGTYYFVCLPHGFVGMKGVLIVSPLSVSIEEEKELPIEPWPNPTTGKVNIPGRFDRMEVYDLTGKTIGAYKDTPIDLSNVKEGIYILRVSTGSQEMAWRIQKVVN